MWRILDATVVISLAMLQFCTMDFVHVRTPFGVLEGYRRVGDYRIPGQVTNTVDVFLGVPYAKAPTGANRFMAPVHMKPWQGIRHATYYPPMCMQANNHAWFTDVVGVPKFRMSEDCLFLNLFSPQTFQVQQHPVMVYLHGGSNKLGSGNHYDGHVLASLGVIVVLPNYRLGPFGFLSTAENVIPGNVGILDQVMVLRWIKDNIAAFGGDPHNVTLFGNSAGGWDITAHLVSPLSKGLFHGAIIQSGSGLSTLALPSVDDHSKPFQELSRRLGCSRSTDMETLRCLQSVPAKELLTKTLDHYCAQPDGRVLPGSLGDLLRNGINPNITVIIGMTSGEWARFILNDPIDDLKNNVPTREIIGHMFPAIPSKCQDLVTHLYSNLEHMHNMSIQRDNLLQINADRYILSPSLKLADVLYRAGTKVYFYQFDHAIPVNLPALEKYQWLSQHSYHESELPFIFGAPYSREKMINVWHDGNYSDGDKKLSSTIMRMWTNFAKTRNPASGMSGTEWLLYHPKSKDYLHITIKGPRMARKLRTQQATFWTHIFPDLCLGDLDLTKTPSLAPSPTIPTVCPKAIPIDIFLAVMGTTTSCIVVIVIIVMLYKCLFKRRCSQKVVVLKS